MLIINYKSMLYLKSIQCSFCLLLILSSCTQEDIIIKNTIEISKNIINVVDQKSNQQNCLCWKEFGGYLSYSDASVAKHYLRPNGFGYKFKDSSNLAIKEEYYMAYAYKVNSDTMLHIRIHEGLGDSIVRVLEINEIHSNQFQSSYFLISPHRKKELYKPQKMELVLDKINHEVGDTIRGYTFFQGMNKNKELLKFNLYFKCIIGESSNPLDYINTYPRCEGIVTELGFGKSRNILAPKIDAKKKDRKWPQGDNVR